MQLGVSSLQIFSPKLRSRFHRSTVLLKMEVREEIIQPFEYTPDVRLSYGAIRFGFRFMEEVNYVTYPCISRAFYDAMPDLSVRLVSGLRAINSHTDLLLRFRIAHAACREAGEEHLLSHGI